MIKSFDFPCRDFFIKIFKEKVFLVGGSIRDFLLYNVEDAHRDIDLVVTDHNYEEIEAILKSHGKTNTVGKSFAVIKFTKDGHVFDIAVPRKDVIKDEDSVSHKNFLIESGAHISLEEDLGRRDFTCNSIAQRLLDNAFIDPFDGVKAIRERQIVMTGPETFFDDPLRILRGARFASVHRFSISPEIYIKSKEVPLDGLSEERIVEELFRVLLESERPSLGLTEYWRLSVLEKLFPRWSALALTIQDAIFHPETDEYGHHTVWAHTLIALDIAKRLCSIFQLSRERELALLLGTLLHDVAKPATTKWEFKKGRMTVTSIYHDSRGEQMALDFLEDLKIETRNGFPLKTVVGNLVRNHHRIYELHRNRKDISFKAISRLAKDLDSHDFLLLLLDFADRMSREPDPLNFPDPKQDDIISWYLRTKEEYNINKETIKPLVMGRHLIAEGLTPGVFMGGSLKTLYEKQLDGEFNTLEDGLALFRREMPAGKKLKKPQIPGKPNTP